MIPLGSERVIVLVRDGCHLCIEALATIEDLCSRLEVSWRSMDVDADAALKSEYSDHVPVTFVDGRLHARWFVDRTELTAALGAAMPGPSRD